MLLGGRVAEALVLDDITTGASNDIERASDLARKMVMKYGMSEKLGPINFSGGQNEVFLGRDFGHTHEYSETLAAEIDNEVHSLIMDGYHRAEKILTEHMDQLHKVAQYLFLNEKMDGETFEKMMNGEDVSGEAEEKAELPESPDKPETPSDDQ